MKSYQLTIDPSVVKLYIASHEVGEIHKAEQFTARTIDNVVRVFDSFEKAETWLMDKSSESNKKPINQQSLFT